MNDDNRTDDERLLLELIDDMPEDLQDAMLRLMHYIVAHPEDSPDTVEKMDELLQVMRRVN